MRKITNQARHTYTPCRLVCGTRVMALICAIYLLLTACGASDEEKWQEQYNLGERYLNEGDYDQAIVSFTAAIEIDANRTSAYLGRAKAYAAAGTEESSEEYLTLSAADYAAAMDLSEGGEVTAEIYAERGDVYDALASLTESSDAAAADEYRSTAVSDYEAAINLGGAAEDVYIRAAEIYIQQEEYSNASAVVSMGLDVYPENEELKALSEETAALIDAAKEAARLAAAQAELDALAQEYLDTAHAYEEAGDLNAAIYTLYRAYRDTLYFADLPSDYFEESLWDYYEEFYEEWKRILVPITAIWIYDSEGTLVSGKTYEYDDSKRMILQTDLETSGNLGIVVERYCQYEYDGDDWACARSTTVSATSIKSDGSWGGSKETVSEYAERYLVKPYTGGWYSGGYSGPSYNVEADPYGSIRNEEVLSKSDYGEYGSTEGWDYMEITYDDRGLVTRIDCYYEDGSSSGYALLEYGEQ